MSFVQPEPTSGCWLWMGKINQNGYGFFTFQLKDGTEFKGGAHRASYIINRLQSIRPNRKSSACHKCNNKVCVNPDHLYLGSQQTNMRDFSDSGGHRNKKKTHCSRNHAFDEENTLLVTNKNKPWVKERRCRKCAVIRTLASRKRKKAFSGK